MTKRDLEGSVIIELHSVNCFIVGIKDQILLYNSKTFHQVEGVRIPINLLKSKSREPTQILALQKTLDEQYIAVITGKKLIMQECMPNQLYLVRLE